MFSLSRNKIFSILSNSFQLSIFFYILNILLISSLFFFSNKNLIIFSSLIQIFLFISIREKIMKFFSLIILIMYQLPFYLQIINFEYFNFQIGLGNFYEGIPLYTSFEIYRPVHLIISIFLTFLISTSFLPKIVKKDELSFNKRLTKYLIIFLIFFNFTLLVLKLYDLYTIGGSKSLHGGIHNEFLSISIFGQLIKKINFLSFFALSYFAYKKQLFTRYVAIVFFIIFILSVVKVSRLETLFCLLLVFINIEKISLRNKFIVITGLTLPFIWSFFSIARGYLYNPEKYHYRDFFKFDQTSSFIELYAVILSNVIGRVSYIYELSTLYYLKLTETGNFFSELFNILIPGSFLKEKNIFYINNFQTMFDLKLINSMYPYKNTAGLGLIGESYYMFQGNFWIVALTYSFIIYGLIFLIKNFEKKIRKAFYLYFLFMFVFKDTFIGATLDFIFLFLFIVFLKFICEISMQNNRKF